MNYFSFNLSLPVVREPRIRKPLNTSNDAYGVLRDIASLAQEVFVVLTLDTRNKLIDKHLISVGTVDAALVHPREIFRAAVVDNATAIIIAHNHPSGDPAPSQEDVRVTSQIVRAGRLMNIELLDHIIVGREPHRLYTSIRDLKAVKF